jgi:hypothetical protein
MQRADIPIWPASSVGVACRCLVGMPTLRCLGAYSTVALMVVYALMLAGASAPRRDPLATARAFAATRAMAIRAIEAKPVSPLGGTRSGTQKFTVKEPQVNGGQPQLSDRLRRRPKPGFVPHQRCANCVEAGRQRRGSL